MEGMVESKFERSDPKVRRHGALDTLSDPRRGRSCEHPLQLLFGVVAGHREYQVCETQIGTSHGWS